MATSWQSPAVSTHVRRLERFRRAHPEVSITRSDGGWTACWQGDSALIRVTRLTRGALLDTLDAVFAVPSPRPSPRM